MVGATPFIIATPAQRGLTPAQHTMQSF